MYVEADFFLGSNHQPMKGILDFTTPDIFVSTTECKACTYPLKYNMKSSLSSDYQDKVNVENIVKNLDIYYPRKKI